MLRRHIDANTWELTLKSDHGERIYVMNDKGPLVPLTVPFETEDTLQRLLAKHPECWMASRYALATHGAGFRHWHS